jgi:general secretion pathway protein G
MIELIFVIVIIGILAAVAIPKLAANRDDATGAICASEVGNLVSELTSNYAKSGYTAFQNLEIDKVSNLKTGVTDGAETSGISTADGTDLATALGAPIEYFCEGKKAAEISVTALNGKEYNLTITTKANAGNPAAVSAAKIITKNYKLDSVGDTAQVPLSY